MYIYIYNYIIFYIIIYIYAVRTVYMQGAESSAQVLYLDVHPSWNVDNCQCCMVRSIVITRIL